jgi:hypothetical protein
VAKPAEQSVGQEITLRAGVTAYAGVNPKTTNQDGGKELSGLIVSVSNGDPNPVSLNVGSFVVDSRSSPTGTRPPLLPFPSRTEVRLGEDTPPSGPRPAEYPPCP